MKGYLITEETREEDGYTRDFENKDTGRGYQSEPMFDSNGGKAARERRWRKEWADDRD